MKYWTKEETARALRMLRDGKTAAEIGASLDRSERSVWCRFALMRRHGEKIPFMPRQSSILKSVDDLRIHPLVKRVLKRAVTEGYNFKRLAKRSGVTDRTIGKWGTDNPQIHNFVAVANAVGYRVVLVDDEGREAA